MPTPKKTDAIAMLKADHRKVEDLFAKFESARSADRKKTLAQQICLELMIHTKIEEDIFYPACSGEIEQRVVKEAYVEHDGAKVLIADIQAGGTGDDFYDAKVKVLSEVIKHHVREEEKPDGMFAQAPKAGLDLAMLGEQLAGEKAELMMKYKGQGTGKPQLHSLQHASIR
jgi:hypothetical protein